MINISKHLPYILVIITSSLFNLWAQISPGELTNKHAQLEGISNCTKCHELGTRVENKKCLDCHSEIKSSMISNSGFHGSNEVKDKNCSSCHNEHHGRNFRIINFDPNSFDHNKTGYSLTGKHNKAECKKCHKPDFIIEKDLRKRKGTYLGLNTQCFSCHEDNHEKTLGDKCDNCHGTDAFKPAVKFNHSTSAYKLRGAHIKVECVGCHKIEDRNGKKYQAFKNIPFQNCTPCHKDVHQGSLGPNCASCHQTSSFKQINGSAFDHSKTKYPLIGKHNLVTCNNCHKNSSSFKMKFALCTDCHKDYHKAQFVVNDVTQNCLDCHSENGFRPSLFTLEMHKKGKFQITGAHLATPCESCHYKKELWDFKGIKLECISCHKNIHENALKPEFLPDNNCGACHQTENWKTSGFDHGKTSFQLLGKHLTISCGPCHRKTEEEKTTIIFSPIKKECESCHKDVHYDQFKVDGISDCSRCHAYENWKAEKFDHNKTQYVLDGAHKNVECVKCHPKVEVNGNIFTKYKLEEFTCATCHKK